MKKITSIVLALALALSCMLVFTGCGEEKSADFTVGVCQLMKHDSLDQATEGFKDALEAKMKEAGKSVSIDVQIPGDTTMCGTIVKTFVTDKADLIMANATPALVSAASATSSIPVLGTSVTDYADTFQGNIPANVSGTSDAVPFAEQAQMMIDTLGLVEGDVVGVLYCTSESNSKLQYEAVKALFEEKNITVEEYTFSETTELQAVATSMAGSCKAVYIPSDNTVAQNDALVGNICAKENVPVFTSYGGTICYASLAIDYYQLGYETGIMAAQILLDGKKPADMEIKTLTPTTVYNEELCAQLGIEVPEN